MRKTAVWSDSFVYILFIYVYMFWFNFSLLEKIKNENKSYLYWLHYFEFLIFLIIKDRLEEENSYCEKCEWELIKIYIIENKGDFISKNVNE
jgi:hypothetical protein